MKNILCFIAALNAGGAERVMVNLANEWSKTHQVTILIFENTPCFYQLDPKVKYVKMNLSLPSKGLKRFWLIPWIEWKRYRFFRNYITQNHFDFILSFVEIANFISCLCKMLHPAQTIFLSERNDPAKQNPLFRFFTFVLYRYSNAVICQNEYVKKYYQSKGFKIPLPVLPNPVNFRDIPANAPTQKRREIVTVGRLTAQKNHALLIDAFSEIASAYPQYTLKIYGTGPLESALKQQIASLKLEKRVLLMGTKKRVMFEVQGSDIFVLPSNFEGFPNVLIEAMASGMPVISSDFPTGVARQLIKDGENGFLFPVGDKTALVQALKNMLACPDKWAQMGAQNRQIARQYTAEKVSADWLLTITKIIGENNYASH